MRIFLLTPVHILVHNYSREKEQLVHLPELSGGEGYRGQGAEQLFDPERS